MVPQTLPGATAVLVGLAALGALVLPGSYEVTQHYDTMAHEGAHAMVGSALGRRVYEVSVSRDGSGWAWLAPGGAVSLGLTLLAGYLGPSMFGLGAAELIERGHSVAVPWLTLLALALLVLVMRSPFGLAVTALTGTLIFAVARYAPVGGQVTLAYGIAWFLLMSGPATAIRHGRWASDADMLRRLTRLPRGVWAAVWLAGSAAALVFGGSLLV
jgi:Peptidase M50B-like